MIPLGLEAVSSRVKSNENLRDTRFLPFYLVKAHEMLR